MIRFHKPLLEELRFRQQLLSDEQTMAYNARWGGAVGFPQERWAGWYSRWVEHPDRRFYAYLYSEEEKAFVGEAAYHFDEELDGCRLHRGCDCPQPVPRQGLRDAGPAAFV